LMALVCIEDAPSLDPLEIRMPESHFRIALVRIVGRHFQVEVYVQLSVSCFDLGCEKLSTLRTDRGNAS
jgi:hypothetical protein